MIFARYTNCFAFLTFILLLVPACEPEEDTPDAGQNDATDTDTLTGEDPTIDALDSQDAECDRFCVFDRWIDALDGSTFVGCMCQTMRLDVTRVSQDMIDGCLMNEQQVLNSPRDFVETDCVEALTPDQLEQLVEYTACYFERVEQVSPCVRAMQAGELCGSCEQFSNPDQRFPCSARSELRDRIASCYDGIPGFL